MGWLRLVGSLKLQVSFAKEPYERDYILQERPIILRSLRIVATPQLVTARTSVAKRSEKAGPYPKDIFKYMGSTRCHDTMGWLRLVGSVKLQVSFAEYRLFYRALLQKRPIVLSILLTVATPYTQETLHFPHMSHVQKRSRNIGPFPKETSKYRAPTRYHDTIHRQCPIQRQHGIFLMSLMSKRELEIQGLSQKRPRDIGSLRLVTTLYTGNALYRDNMALF